MDGRPTENDGGFRPVRGDVWDIEQMIVVTVPHENYRGAVSRSRKESLDRCGISIDYRTTAHPGSHKQFIVGNNPFGNVPERARSPRAEPRITEERRRQ
jgi:hypothetical protein